MFSEDKRDQGKDRDFPTNSFKLLEMQHKN